MRLVMVLAIGATLSAGCSGDQPPAVPGANPGSSATAAPSPAIQAPSEADLHGAPPPDAEDLRELYDVTRDLQAISRQDTGAVSDLAEDLSRFAPADTTAGTKTLAENVGRALQGRALDEATARRLTVLLYVAVNASGLTPAQRSAAAAQLRETLGSTGAGAADAEAVAAQIR